tara:strand:- start:787 stop:987 length:201 start_codon:yes stop_codon:yes gene_type:complete
LTKKKNGSSYRKRFPKGKDWKKPKPNPFDMEGQPRISESSWHGTEIIGVSMEKYQKLKDRIKEFWG